MNQPKSKFKITQKMFDDVYKLAHQYYTNNHIDYRKADGFLCECYTKAVVACLNSEDLLNCEIEYEGNN